MDMNFAYRLAAHLDELSRVEEFSGVVWMQRGETPLFSGAYGYAQRGWRVSNRLDTRFRIASISKLFTAVGVLQQVEAGRIGLEDRLLAHLELGATTIPPEVTVRHLLSMTAGIADWFDESGDWEANWNALCREHPIYLFRRNADYLPLFVQAPPLFPPGARHQYNGAGYILLGLLLEQLSGLDYFEYVRRHIFECAGMERAGFVALESVEAEVAEGYLPLPGADGQPAGWKKNIYSTTPEAAADGGATCSAADLLRFNQALRGGELLGPELTHAMLTPQVDQFDGPRRGYLWKYGFGNSFILDDAGAVLRWGHTGEEDGVSCRLYYYPQHDLDVIILGNQSWCAGDLAWTIHDWILAARP